MLCGNPGPRAKPGRILNGVVAGGFIALMLIGTSQTGRAQTPASSASSPTAFDNLLEKLNLKAKRAPTPDFVEKSRPVPGAIHFIPVGTPHPDRAVKVLTPAEVTALTADLDSSRTAQQRRAGIKPAPVPLKMPKTASKVSTVTLR